MPKKQLKIKKKKTKSSNSPIWKKKNETNEINKKKKWKWCRNYDWTYSKNNYFSKNTILNDKLMLKMWKSNLSSSEKNRRWLVNFLQKGFINENLKKTKRVFKFEHQRQLYYKIIEGTKLHEKEDFHQKSQKKHENKTLNKIITRKI